MYVYSLQSQFHEEQEEEHQLSGSYPLLSWSPMYFINVWIPQKSHFFSTCIINIKQTSKLTAFLKFLNRCPNVVLSGQETLFTLISSIEVKVAIQI